MGGEGHMLDMIRRLKEGRDSANLRRVNQREDETLTNESTLPPTRHDS